VCAFPVPIDRSFVRSTATRRRSRLFVGVRSSSSDEPNRFVFTVVDDVFVARPAGGCLCRRRRRRRSGRTHCLADVCMCKQYGLSHSGTRACAGHTGTDTLGRMYVRVLVCVNSTVYPTLGHACGTHWDTLGHTGTCLYVCVNSMVLWFGSVRHPSIHPSIRGRRRRVRAADAGRAAI